MQAGMQLELYGEWLGQAPPRDVGGPRHFCYSTTWTTPIDFEAIVKFEFPLQR